ncbi:hypothetical protein [Micromonospora purpureochromogenes]|uniref:Uncharacterized protein n=1 Tax=Micromonospora purpureochromogenes TaxID=47872 RepID=A0ABX2RI15_9ACTN|nr:hypothetical protein [Micromonospora purpureochromogenes]NYF55780.1 hypothetical protein [Micromonospora purpureochromogenes]
MIATEDTNSYYRIARSAVVEVTAGGATVVDAGLCGAGRGWFESGHPDQR